MLSDVCLSVAYVKPKSGTEKPRKTKIGTEVAHVIRDSDTTFEVKRSKVKVTRPLCSLLCWRGNVWPWETAVTLRSSRWRKAFRRPRGREGRGHIVAAAHLQLVSTIVPCLLLSSIPVKLPTDAYPITTVNKLSCTFLAAVFLQQPICLYMWTKKKTW